MTNLEPQKVLHLYLEEAKKTPKLTEPRLITEKIDGWFCYVDYTVGSGWGYIKSSRNRTIPAFQWAKEGVFSFLPAPKEDCRLLMEANIPGMDFYTMNGLFNRSIGEYSCFDVMFNLHDYIPLRTYFKDNKQNTAIERFKTLQQLGLDYVFKSMRKVPLIGISNDKNIWLHYFDQIVSAGGEGIILKRENSLYSPGKRNSDLLKIKEDVTLDILCTRAYRTVGEKGNDNVNLVLTRKNGVDIHVRLGKDSDVLLFEQNRGNFLGKVCEIKAMKELEDGNLREARFIRVREDKQIKDIE